MATPLPVITVHGTPSERGESYGKQAAPLVARAIAMYRREFARMGIEWDEALRLARLFMPSIEAYDAALALEIEAIAMGAGESVEAIVVLNARTELAFWNERERKDRGIATGALVEVDECTSAVALPEATRDGRLIHAQNWDWLPECAEHSLALRIRGADVPDSLNFVEAGQLARHGFNAEGVAITAMGLHSNGDYGRIGIPNPLIRRKMLACDTLSRAIGVIYNSARSFSHNIMVSHPGGEAFGFETTPDGVYWLEPAEGIMTHANHFKSPQALQQVCDINIARCPDTLCRDSRVRHLLARRRGKITAETFREVFSDTFGTPNSVLRHPSPRPGGMLSATVYTLIMDTAGLRAWVAPKPYEGATYTEYGLA
ncbi:MAG TPA: C45 family peptidase [Burkholderiales bacterium]|nr:C45 family peptidase [Burkholderiales bacterium]